MCGHVGFAGEHKEADKIITFLLVLDILYKRRCII